MIKKNKYEIDFDYRLDNLIAGTIFGILSYGNEFAATNEVEHSVVLPGPVSAHTRFTIICSYEELLEKLKVIHAMYNEFAWEVSTSDPHKIHIYESDRMKPVQLV